MAKKKVASVEVDTVVNNFGGDFLNLYIPIPAWSVSDLPVSKMARMLCDINGDETWTSTRLLALYRQREICRCSHQTQLSNY